jgi:hypothetical protein
LQHHSFFSISSWGGGELSALVNCIKIACPLNATHLQM